METLHSRFNLHLLAKTDSDSVDFIGCVQSIRETKNATFVLLTLGKEMIQLVGKFEQRFQVGACIKGRGKLVPAKLSNVWLSYRKEEIQVESYEVLSSPSNEAMVDWSKKELNVGGETFLNLRAVTLRHEKEKAIFHIQNTIVSTFRQTLERLGFIEMRTPKLCAQGAEGGANVFEVKYFERLAYLAQSPQFYKEFGTGIFQKVFEVGPVFRAEKHNSNRHLNEYTSMDIEFGPLVSFTEIMELELLLLQNIFEQVKLINQRELEILNCEIPDIQTAAVISFEEAKEKARELGVINETEDLNPEEEKVLGKYYEEKSGSPLLFVTHYPIAARPFYTRKEEGTNRSLGFDLLFRGTEITTGGQRIHEHGEIIKSLKERGMEPSEFEFFTTAHHNGLPPHGGFGLGLERLTALLLGVSNIKSCTYFPRDRTRLTP